MRIGLVSDIHCNDKALRTALAEMEREVDLVLCAGDIAYQYRFGNAVADLLRQYEIPTILGNHEKVILSIHGAKLRQSGSISAENLAFLQSLPDQRLFHLDGKKLLLAHGAPWDNPNDIACEYIYPTDTKKLQQIAKLDADIVILGHTHVPMVYRENGKLIVNPGSAGEPRAYQHTRRMTYAILDIATGEVEMRDLLVEAIVP